MAADISPNSKYLYNYFIIYHMINRNKETQYFLFLTTYLTPNRYIATAAYDRTWKLWCDDNSSNISNDVVDTIKMET